MMGKKGVIANGAFNMPMPKFSGTVSVTTSALQAALEQNDTVPNEIKKALREAFEELPERAWQTVEQLLPELPDNFLYLAKEIAELFKSCL
jgi:hypothetical protein